MSGNIDWSILEWFYIIFNYLLSTIDDMNHEKLGNIWNQCKEQHDLSLKFPQGCMVSSHNSKVSIEQNFASSKNVAVVETIKL